MNPTKIGICIAVSMALCSAIACNRSSEASATVTPVAPTPTATSAPAVMPPLGAAQLIEPGVLVHEVTLSRAGVPMKVWVYLPEKPTAGKLPCVLIAPAGSPLVIGADLGDGDRREHVPYVKAGFAVVAYEIDGHVPDLDKATDRQIAVAAVAFKNAHAGVDNARAALDYVFERVPTIDPEHIVSAGHSSAATLALLVAAQEPRVKACAAYAPVTDVVRRVQPDLASMNRAIPGFADFVKDSSPRTHIARLTGPVFLFHAQDDSNVPIAETTAFANELKKSNSRVTFVRARSGNHCDSMIAEGIPKAIEWMKGVWK
jgi:dipeptidyl aminopeptidase/acylaminoacyl peptidase